MSLLFALSWVPLGAGFSSLNWISPVANVQVEESIQPRTLLRPVTPLWPEKTTLSRQENILVSRDHVGRNVRSVRSVDQLEQLSTVNPLSDT